MRSEKKRAGEDNARGYFPLACQNDPKNNRADLNPTLSSSRLDGAHDVDQSRDFLSQRIAGALGAHQSIRGSPEALDHRRRVEVAVGN